MAELTGLEAIAADEKLSAEVKSLAVDAAALDTVETAKTLEDGNGVITFQSLVDRMKADNVDAKDSDIQAAVVAWWVF
jgi:hypothetical protein